MLISFKRGQTGIVLRVKLLNNSVSTGAGLTALTSGSAGLVIATIADNEATTTRYRVADANVETIATLGTYAAPSTNKCRFREVDATNHPGVYEIQLADARYGVSNAKSLLVSILGASNLAETDCVIPLMDMDPYDAVRQGMTALPNAAAAASGGLPTVDANNAVKLQSGTGSNQISLSSGAVLLQPTQSGVTIPTVTTLTNAPSDSAGTTTLLSRIGSALTINSGKVTVGTNDDKTGYSLSASQTFSVTGNITGNVSGSVTGDVGGKILGGGSGTITGTGVRAVDASGNAIATASALDTAQTSIDRVANSLIPYSNTVSASGVTTTTRVYVGGPTSNWSEFLGCIIVIPLLNGASARLDAVGSDGNGTYLDVSPALPNSPSAAMPVYGTTIRVPVMTASGHVTLADGSLTAAKIASNALTSGSVDVTFRRSLADALLTRDWTEVPAAANRSVLNALRFLRNKWSLSGSTLTVNQEDDATPAWTASITSTPTADPIIGSDPS